MKNKFQVFTNEESGQLRTVEIDGEIHFVGKDVASILGYTNPHKAIRDHVDEEDKGVNEMFTPSGKQEVIIINESGLYSLILSSKLPNAKKFKRWVTSEVLPAIRKTGFYAAAGATPLFISDRRRQVKTAISTDFLSFDGRKNSVCLSSKEN